MIEARKPDKIDLRNQIGSTSSSKIVVRDLDFYYGRAQALHGINMEIQERVVTAFIGPSGCGKSTFIRTLNRMNDVIAGTRAEGEVVIDGQNIYAPGTDVVELRRRVGMVFQKSNPFPKSVFDNVAYGLRINRMTSTTGELRDAWNVRLETLGRGQGLKTIRPQFVRRSTAAAMHRSGPRYSSQCRVNG